MNTTLTIDSGYRRIGGRKDWFVVNVPLCQMALFDPFAKDGTYGVPWAKVTWGDNGLWRLPGAQREEHGDGEYRLEVEEGTVLVSPTSDYEEFISSIIGAFGVTHLSNEFKGHYGYTRWGIMDFHVPAYPFKDRWETVSHYIGKERFERQVKSFQAAGKLK